MPSHLTGNAEILEETLMGGPELAPHRLLHLLLCVYISTTFYMNFFNGKEVPVPDYRYSNMSLISVICFSDVQLTIRGIATGTAKSPPKEP